MSTTATSTRPSLVTSIRSKLNTIVWTLFLCLCAVMYGQIRGVLDIRVLTAEDNSHEAQIHQAQTELAQDIFEPVDHPRHHSGR